MPRPLYALLRKMFNGLKRLRCAQQATDQVRFLAISVVSSFSRYLGDSKIMRLKWFKNPARVSRTICLTGRKPILNTIIVLFNYAQNGSPAYTKQGFL